MFVLNFGVESLEQSIKLGQLVIFRFPQQFPALNTTFSKRTTKKTVLFTMFLLFKLFFSCGGERKPT